MNPTERSAVIGIEVGLTHVTMAHLAADGRVRLLPNAEGHDRTPAAVHFYDKDGAVVGDEAIKVADTDPETTVLDVPSTLGEEGTRFTFYDRAWTPQELMALVLRKLRDDASALLGFEVEDAAFAVPGFFDSAVRAALTEAATLAGWKPLAVFPSATTALVGAQSRAAAVVGSASRTTTYDPGAAGSAPAGFANLPDGGNVLVIDVRERSVESTLVHRLGGSLTVVDTEAQLGVGLAGVRDALRGMLAERWRVLANTNPDDDAIARQILRQSSHDVFNALSHRATIPVQVGIGAQRTPSSIGRERFIEGAWPQIIDLVRPAAAILRRCSPDQLPDALVLVGDGPRVPGLRRALSVILKLDPLRDDTMQDAVARGAAWLAAVRFRPDHPGLTPSLKARAEFGSGSDTTPHTTTHAPASPAGGETNGAAHPHRAVIGLADGGHKSPVHVREVTTLSLGLIILDNDRMDRVVELIPTGTALPARFRGRFTYAYENMTSVRVEVTEGRGTTRDQVRVIGTVELKGLPPRPRGTPIDVTYLYGEDQILAVELADVDTGRTVKADLTFRGALTASELELARSRAGAVQVG